MNDEEYAISKEDIKAVHKSFLMAIEEVRGLRFLFAATCFVVTVSLILQDDWIWAGLGTLVTIYWAQLWHKCHVAVKQFKLDSEEWL